MARKLLVESSCHANEEELNDDGGFGGSGRRSPSREIDATEDPEDLHCNVERGLSNFLDSNWNFQIMELIYTVFKHSDTQFYTERKHY